MSLPAVIRSEQRLARKVDSSPRCVMGNEPVQLCFGNVARRGPEEEACLGRPVNRRS